MLKVSTEQSMAVTAEFPRDLVPLLRCSWDAGELDIATELQSNGRGIVDARLRCRTCGAEYSIENGIARMINGPLSPEDEHEIAIRDVEYAFAQTPPGPYVPPPWGTWRSEFSDFQEIPPHLAELEPLNGRKVLEIGCGDGRFTMLMAQMGASVLAVDFSINALRKVARRYERGGIFIEHCNVVTLRWEAAPYFAELRIHKVRPRVPFASRLPLAWALR